MGVADDIRTIIRQEQELVFPAFDEATAFELGARIRDRALREEFAIIVDIRTWDRPLVYAAMPGSNASNPDWARRKTNVVRRFQKSTYRMVLEQDRPDRTFKPGEGLDIADYVLAGGGFPIKVRNAGVIGCIAVSGLPERQDHEVVVRALCEQLGLDYAGLALAVEATKA